jgi:hypothetical protein
MVGLVGIQDPVSIFLLVWRMEEESVSRTDGMGWVEVAEDVLKALRCCGGC